MYEFLQLGAKIIILAAISIIAVYTSLRVWRAELDLTKLVSPRRMVERSVDESLSWLPIRELDALYQDGQIVARTGESTLDEENSKFLFKEIYQSNRLVLDQEFEFQKWRLRFAGAETIIGISASRPQDGRIIENAVCEILGLRKP